MRKEQEGGREGGGKGQRLSMEVREVGEERRRGCGSLDEAQMTVVKAEEFNAKLKKKPKEVKFFEQASPASASPPLLPSPHKPSWVLSVHCCPFSNRTRNFWRPKSLKSR